jgi:hypothetical protein
MSAWTDLRDDVREAFISQGETRPDHLPPQAFPSKARKDVVIPVQYLGAFFPKTRTYTPSKTGSVLIHDTRTNNFKTIEINISFKRLVEMVEGVMKEYFEPSNENFS